MGLFGNLFGGKHDESWYLSSKGKDAYVKACYSSYDRDGQIRALSDYFKDYIDSLPNIKKARDEENHFIDTRYLGIVMAELAIATTTDELGRKRPAEFAGYPDIFNTELNWFLRFIKRLNHSFYGDIEDMVSRLILFNNKVDVDKDDWLYDKELFYIGDHETDEKAYQRVKAKIIELGLND